MANWLEGTFRARGKEEDLVKFVKNALINHNDKYAEILGDKYGDGDIYVKFEPASGYNPNWITIFNEEKNLRRHYIILHDYEVCLKRLKNNELMLVEDFKCAWSIDDEKLPKLAKLYNIDIRVNGYECGYKFEADFEFNRHGITTISHVKTYIDYEWECPMPLLGG